MRHLLLAALALAACSSDPPPQCGTGGTSCADAGSPLDRPHVVDLGPLDAGADVVDAFVSTDPAPMVDVGFDAGTPDVPVARLDGCGLDPDGACVTPGDVPPDQGVPDSGPTDVPVDRVEGDARLDCVTDENVRCTTHEQCQAACLPRDPSSGFIAWCCPGRHHCISTADPRGCAPYLVP